MLLKLDENLGRSHVELLRNAGYEAHRVHDQVYLDGRIRPYGNAFVTKGDFSSRLISTLPMSAATSLDRILGFFYYGRGVEVVLRFFKS